MPQRLPVREIDPKQPPVTDSRELDLYEKREKIYTRKIEGFFQRIRLYTGWPLLLGYFLLPWINWNGHQSLLWSLPERKFYILNWTFWPQDFVFLAWLLIICAFGLFFVTNWLGRVWCGYTCPQTVWTAIYMWMEQFAEGSRNQRIKLDQAPWSAEKLFKKGLKHAMWLGFGFWTGLTFVGYFTPIRELLPDLLLLQAHPVAAFWTLFFMLATYVNAGWMREQVCKYMCPYARFQSAMFDRDTLIISYDAARGEPRGSRKRGDAAEKQELGDCINCTVCVQVCPTGIDIRDGLQYECIGCALCIDGCNEVMDKMGYPRGLIRYTTLAELETGKRHILRPRLVGYGVAILVMIGLFGYRLYQRIPLELDIIRDRNQLFTMSSDGGIENSYTLKILNMDSAPHRYRITATGIDGLKIQGATEAEVNGSEVLSLPLRLTVPAQQLGQGSRKILFSLEAIDRDDYRITQESRFIGPAQR
ncbi:MAG TPA: cytochrome c oxidase accessory protein CcoG [Pseudomonadales bacterium]|jgi:cytochrome c oxidase accessory protein FixG|nr:cytochrome c oxidase accessory protein CcoG [Pseudomonadales bacterium]